MPSIVCTPSQHHVEAFIETAEANGHRGWALLPQRHPKVWGGPWTQLRTLKNGLLAFYYDELGNTVELVLVGSNKSPIVRQCDYRRTFYCRLRRAESGRVIKADSAAGALRIFSAKEGVPENSTLIVISAKPARGIYYRD